MNPGSNADDIGHRFIHFLERPVPIVDIGKRARHDAGAYGAGCKAMIAMPDSASPAPA